MGGFIPPEEFEQMSTLQLLDLVQTRLEFMGIPCPDHQLLRHRVEEMEEIQDQAREALERLSAALDMLRSPALKVGTFLELREDGTACVLVSGAEYVCTVDPALPINSLEAGMRVTLNEAFSVIGSLGRDTHGPILKVNDVLLDGRLRIGQENGSVEGIVKRAPHLRDVKIKVGHEIRLDATQRIAVEVLGTTKRTERSLTELPATPWESIGGQEAAVKGIRDAVELPYLHAELFQTFQKLLYILQYPVFSS